MRFNIKNGILFLALLAVAACKEKDDNEYTPEKITETSAELNEYFEKEFQKDVDDSPMLQTYMGVKTDYGKWDDLSHLKYAEDLKKAKKRLEDLKKVDANALDENTYLSYRLFKQEVENTIEDYDFRFYNYPVNQMNGYQSTLPAFLINMHKIDSIPDARAYISRLKAFPRVIRDVIGNIKIREQNGIVPPIFVFDMVLRDSKNIIKGKPFNEEAAENSTLLEDFKSKVDVLDIPRKEKNSLLAEAEEALLDSVETAYKNLINTVENQQKRAGKDDGVWKFPKGDKFYENALKRTTTTDLTSDEIHDLGLNEVKRIQDAMREIMKSVDFEGSLQEFFEFIRNDEQFYYGDSEEGREAYLSQTRSIINRMKDDLDQLFLTKPEADIRVKAVENFREKSAGRAFYQQPALDGSRPGIYYANLYDMKAMPKYEMEALAYHEGIPGHHMQLAIAQELEDVPIFRKFQSYTAYIEGWGLYSELIPKEIGYYEDPYSDFGRLSMELWRACRLVVDTGIHAKKWTREEGIDYYRENTPNVESEAVKMVERHIVMPGQATAYKIGMNKILELRGQAKQEIGETFDIREFHDVILLDGAIPLNILDEKIEKWIISKK